jgi:nucleotide-binding universal stress UspA family protein
MAEHDGGEILSFHLDQVKPGERLDDLLHHAAEAGADLLVLGARSHVTARRVAMLAPCSVLMVPDNTTLSLDHLLVPVDFSEAAAEAFREGVRLAEGGGGRCTVVAVECDDDPWLDWRDQPHKLDEKLLQFVRQSATGSSAAVTCLVEPIEHSTTALGRGLHAAPRNIEGADIASTIVNVAERQGATVIAIGTRGRTRAASVLLGSVTEKVVQLSPIPVLVVKQPGERLTLIRGLLERLRQQQPSLVVG